MSETTMNPSTNRSRPRARTGGRILVDALRIHGADTVFGVPGESYLAALDAMHDAGDAMRFVVCRQEGGAAFMADSYAKLTGRPGICFVTRGPGALNAAIGVHTAYQDSSPMILLVGQVSRSTREREGFQEVDFKALFTPIAKWAAEITDPARIPEFVSRAFHESVAGRPGPVVLSLPEDVLSAEATVADARAHATAMHAPRPVDLDRLRELVSEAERPLAIVGGGGWTAQASAALQVLAERWDLPVATSLRCQDYFDNHHRNYVGDAGIGIRPELAARIRDADLVLAIGPRLGEMTTQGYTLLKPPVPTQRLVHVHPGAEELGRVYSADLLINSALPEFIASAAALAPIAGPRWAKWREDMRREYVASLSPRPQPSPVDMGVVMQTLNRLLPQDAIICNGAGNYSGWIHRFRQFRVFRSQLAPTSGAMGYGMPAAVAAKIVCPERTVVAFAGDGCFMMNAQEFATAVQYKLPIVVIVVNNGIYGTIQMHQEINFPGRPFAVGLTNPDFAAYAAAYGAHSQVVTETADFEAALQRALECGGPALIELRVAVESISAGRTLSEIREKAAAALGTS